MSVTAIFGGTFNPFHIGHYEMLKALQEDSQIEKILILPDRIPPHKVCIFLADDNIRIEMCNIAARNFSKAQVCLIEFEREGKSYTYDTVIELKNKYPTTDFVFVCGADMLVTFDGWYKYQELMKEIPFIVFKRTTTNQKLFNDCVERFREMGMRIRVMDNEIPFVSSTDIRKKFGIAKNLIPDDIYNFLVERGVYND